MRNWKKGPPPHIGWWQASIEGMHERVWRWWNGYAWSVPVGESKSAGQAAFEANSCMPMSANDVILWNDYWPENARVPRIKPE